MSNIGQIIAIGGGGFGRNPNQPVIETYIIEEDRGSKNICIYGAAAHLIQSGQRIIILSYASLSNSLAKKHKPTVLHLDETNSVKD